MYGTLWLTSFSLFLSFIHIALCIDTLFLFVAEWYSINVSLPHFSVRDMNCFYFLAASNNGVINIPAKYSCFHFAWLFPRNKIAETWGTLSDILRNCQTFPQPLTLHPSSSYEAWYLPSSLPSLCLLGFSCPEYIWFINDFFHLWQWNCVSSLTVSFYTFCFWCHIQETHSKQCSFSAASSEHFIFNSHTEAVTAWS